MLLSVGDIKEISCCRNIEFGDGNLESGGERQEVHIGQAYACIY